MQLDLSVAFDTVDLSVLIDGLGGGWVSLGAAWTGSPSISLG